MKKRNYLLVLLILSVILLSACSSGTTKKDYETISSKLADVQEENKELKFKLSDIENDYDTLNNYYKKAKEKIREYEEIIEPYKELTKAEVALNAKQAQAELEKAAADEAKKEAQKKAAKEKEKKKGYNTGITYNQLARTPDKYEGKKVKFTGTVIQVIEGDDVIELRFAVNDDYDQIILLEYDSSIVNSRVLEDDTITIYGIFDGLISYESTLGGTITIPSVSVDKIDQ